jgi:hypothetical protein
MPAPDPQPLGDELPEFGPSAPIAPPTGGDEPSFESEQANAPAPAANSHSEPQQQSSPPDSRPVDLSSPAPAAPAPAAEQAPIPNGDFDSSTEGWDGQNAALTLVPGVDGNGVRVARTTTEDSFAFYAEKTLVSKKARAPYKVGAYVRSASPGMIVCLRAEEHTSGPTITTERCAPAKLGWKRLRVRSTTSAKGTKVVFSIHVMAALGGKSFDVDGFQLGGLS